VRNRVAQEWLTAAPAPPSWPREDTIAFGAQLGGKLRAGDVVVLSGPLGAGKTVLAKGIARAMDVEGPVISPTYVLARVHRAHRPGAPAMIHVDLYRCSTTPLSTCSPNSTHWTSTPISPTPSSSWSGRRSRERLSDSHLDIRLERGPDTESARHLAVEPMSTIILAIDTPRPRSPQAS